MAHLALRVSILIGIGLALLAAPAGAATFTFTLSDFDSTEWSIQAGGVGPTATATATSPATGGNPGSFLQITHVMPEPYPNDVNAYWEYSGASFDPGALGAINTIDFSWDRILLPGSNDWVNDFAAIFQGGGGYLVSGLCNSNSCAADRDARLDSTTWETVSTTGNTVSDFTFSPDFSTSGGVITFGIWRANTGNQAGGETTIHGLDNFSITIDYTPIPEPSTGLLVGLGLLVCGSLRTRGA